MMTVAFEACSIRQLLDPVRKMWFGMPARCSKPDVGPVTDLTPCRSFRCGRRRSDIGHYSAGGKKIMTIITVWQGGTGYAVRGQ